MVLKLAGSWSSRPTTPVTLSVLVFGTLSGAARPGSNCWNKDTNQPCGGECASKAGCASHAPGCAFTVNHTDHDGNPAWCYYPEAALGRNCWNKDTDLPCGSECATSAGCAAHAPGCTFQENHLDHDGFPAWCFYPDHPAPPPPATPTQLALALKYLGSMCNGLTSNGCNPFQLPLYDSGSVFVPSIIVQVDSGSVFMDTTQSVSTDNQVQLDETLDSVSNSDSSNFGIDASVPYHGVMFSLGLQHQKLADHMHSSGSTSYYSEISRMFTVFTAAVNDTLKLTAEVAAAADALPATCTTPSDQQEWFTFFEKYGPKNVTFVEPEQVNNNRQGLPGSCDHRLRMQTDSV